MVLGDHLWMKYLGRHRGTVWWGKIELTAGIVSGVGAGVEVGACFDHQSSREVSYKTVRYLRRQR